MNEPADKADEAFADGPLKATRQAEIRDGKRREKRLDRLRLQGFWPLYAAFIGLAYRPPLSEAAVGHMVVRFIGIGVTLLGVLMRIWSMGYLLKKEELATAGPYGRTRNPLYVGTWLIGCGLAMNTAYPWNLALLLIYNVMFYFVYRAQIGIEEEMLTSIYGEPYEEYCRNVPPFFPQLTAWHKGAVSGFSLLRALKNRAWEPILGVALLWAAQVAMWGIAKPLIDGQSFADAWQHFLAGGWIGP
ncbi:MAG: isoprenylcysteine carboxylmethyltransferase family protein [Planctomycetes bacterium]|nr:isoprenylcysteine carboxylmethyltransferase family protein [Planctomycetota bacterium]